MRRRIRQEKNKKHALVFLAACVLVFSFFSPAISSAYEDDELDLKWTFKADGAINKILVDAIDSEKTEPSIIFSSEEKLYILTKNGTKIAEQSLNSKGLVQEIVVKNIDSEEETKEIILGFGWTEWEDVEREYINTTSEGEFTLNEEILYKKATNKGEIKILDTNLNELNSTAVDGWIRGLFVHDFNSDGVIELAIVTGGTDTFYYEIFSPQPENETDENQSSETTTTTTTIEGSEEDDENETDDDDWEDWYSKETYTRVYYNGKIIVFSKNMTLLKEKEFDMVFFDAKAANLYKDDDSEIITASKNKALSTFLYDNLTSDWTYAAPGEVHSVWIGDLQDDGVSEELITYFSDGVSGFQGVTRYGEKFLESRAPLGEKLRHLIAENLDPDREKEIFISTDRNLYVLDLNAKIRIKYPISGIDTYFVSDLDSDNYSEILIAKGDMLYCYTIPKDRSKKKNADILCDRAKEYSNTNYTLAKSYAEEAITLYDEISATYDEKEDCLIIIDVLNQKIIDKAKKEADSLYSRAIGLFAFEDYAGSLTYSELAYEKYAEINNSEGMLSTISLIEKLELELGLGVTTTIVEITATTPSGTEITERTVTTPIQNPSGEKGEFPLIPVGLLLGISIIIASIIFVKLKKQAEKEKDDFGGSVLISDAKEEESPSSTKKDSPPSSQEGRQGQNQQGPESE